MWKAHGHWSTGLSCPVCLWKNVTKWVIVPHEMGIKAWRSHCCNPVCMNLLCCMPTKASPSWLLTNSICTRDTTSSHKANGNKPVHSFQINRMPLIVCPTNRSVSQRWWQIDESFKWYASLDVPNLGERKKWLLTHLFNTCANLWRQDKGNIHSGLCIFSFHSRRTDQVLSLLLMCLLCPHH